MARITLPLSTTVHYIVEERLLSDITNTNYAWLFTSSDDALEMLTEQVQIHGDDRFYTAFIHID